MLDALEKATVQLRQRLLDPTGMVADADSERALIAQAFEQIAAELRELRRAEDDRQKIESQRQADAAARAADFERFYLEFENRYRGAEAEVKDKCRFYLDRLPACDRASARIVDLGCGRGEWLELLREAGYATAYGIDSNPAMIERCRHKQLQVEQAEAIAHLESLPPASLAAATAIHIAEHLPFDELLRLLAAAFQAIEPAGRLILETPNPRNLVVGGNTFHFDPTHRKPLPCELLAFACQHVGFQIFSIEQRHPHPHLQRVAETLPGDVALFSNMLTSGLDYGIVAEKPGAVAAPAA